MFLLQFPHQFPHLLDAVPDLVPYLCVGSGDALLFFAVLAFVDSVVFGEELLLQEIELGASQ